MEQQKERRDRRRRLEETLIRCAALSDEEREERRREHAARETEFLRLKRSKLGAADFEAIKVIGKGAFGEVELLPGGWVANCRHCLEDPPIDQTSSHAKVE